MATQPGKAIILLAHGFREGPIVTCLERMRAASLAVSVVGLTAGLVMGEHGLAVQPDHSLNEWLQQNRNESPPTLVIIPDGRSSATALCSDPRVHRLVKATQQQGGFVATLAADPHLLEAINNRLPGQNNAKNFLRQGKQSSQNFIQQLISLIEPDQNEPQNQQNPPMKLSLASC